MYFVYVLYSEGFSMTYVGLTDDLERRLREHNEGKSGYTSKYLPWEVVHFEELKTRGDARKREKYLKSGA